MNILFAVIVIIIGILNIVVPAEMMMFGRRWQFKEGTEPSDLAVLFTRIGGGAAIAAGIILLFTSAV